MIQNMHIYLPGLCMTDLLSK